MTTTVRDLVTGLTSRLPQVRGRGRLTLWLDRMLTDASKPESYIVVAPVNGVLMQLDLRAWGQKFAYYYREWEGEYVAILRRLYDGGLFIDVGSSLGLYTVGLGAVVRAGGGRIVSVEPLPRNLERQRAAIAMNGLEDLVDVLPIALGSRDDELRLRSDAVGADNNAFLSAEGDLLVKVRALDDVLRDDARWTGRRVGLVKIDVEGFEPEVLRGAHETISRDMPVIFAEFCRERMEINGFEMRESWDFLKSCGYAAYRVERSRLVRISDPARHENLLFIPEERAATLDRRG